MTGIIILAAGASTRMGAPKQNLIYKGKTLLQTSINAALETCQPVIVVLGANADVIKPTINDKHLTIIYNVDWQQGMASSINVGLKELQKTEPEADSAILMLCDQPFVNDGLLNELISKKSQAGIVACAYGDTMGVPALFAKQYFAELLNLTAHEGAKKILIKYRTNVAIINFPLGNTDIDTVVDYKRLLGETGLP